MIGSTCLFGLLVLAQAPQRDADTDLIKRWLAVCQSQAELYSIGSLEAASPRFERLKDPIFRHATPARGNDIGAVFLWVDANQRPMVVSDIFAWSLNNDPKRRVVHECHSLAPEPLDVRLDGEQKWKPKRAGLKWEPLPEAPTPPGSKSQRFRQARELTQNFTAHSIDAQGGRWELRVLPQPVYQYEVVKNQSRETGAMFAVCQGTDPELWLLLESRQSNGKDQWYYACAAFTDYVLAAEYDGKEVWSCPKYQPGVNDEPHWVEGVANNVTAPELPK